jgi:hypothetical protein
MPPFTKLAGPVRNAAGSMVYAFKIGAANPAAWVAGIAVNAPPEQVLPTVLDPRFDPTRAALVDTGSKIPGRPPTAAVSGASITAHVAQYEPGHIAIALSGPSQPGAVLVVSENYYPGWTATSSTRTLPIARVNYNLIGVGLPAGTQHVDLAFHEPLYATGRLLTFIALIVAIMAASGGLILDRRREPSSVS